MKKIDRLVCVEDFAQEAKQVLAKNAKDYFTSGADDEITVVQNTEAFSRLLIRPRVLRDVSVRNLSTMILGKSVKVPLGVSPSAFQGLAHSDGECGSAKAVEAIGGIFILSVFATKSYEEIAAAAPNVRRWFQFYMHKDRQVKEKAAQKAGFEAIVLTLDAQSVGNRRSSRRDPLEFPSHLKSLPNATPDAAQKELKIFELHDIMDHGVTWEAVSWLKSISNLPLVVKGIQTVEDAIIAVSHGVDAIFVSNHGGRQVDTAVPTCDILPEIVRTVKGKCEIYVDGGVRRGTDIFKALALGANMVFVGRPIVYGLAVGGTVGATKVMHILRDELDLTMALSGVSNVSELTPSYVNRVPGHSHL
ncbi:Hydroxyacid oxidase 1 [Folsomia candida]|uniref:(S)-2-hydroxy-acid oxidase n=1 Tax=Folsomia candida TaxID=158441 RepID=A0A226EQG9_FOLCA|nr:Hydroxyacid oxidase 1 [Folsomia candida]